MYTFILFLFAALATFAEIIETPHFHKIKSYASPDTLLVLDIDDTLLVPAQILGTDVWFEHQYKKNQSTETNPLDKTLALWEAIRHMTQVELVEKGSETLIENLQSEKIAIMGLTTQGLALATRTVNQLHSLGIDLSKTAPCKEDCYFTSEHGVLFRKGILFTSGTHKGAALLKYLNQAGKRPKRVVFLNDKRKHLQQVEESMKKEKIPYVGLRYGFSDKRVREFRPEIADIQLRYSSFDRILSDEEAEEILAKEKGKE